MLCVVVFVLCRPEKGEERGWAWVAGESTPEPRRTTGKNEKNKPTVKVPDRPSKVKGERLLKKKNKYFFFEDLVFNKIKWDK
jgi:hypothetical protein